MLIDTLKIGLPLNTAGDRIINWKRPLAEVISESSPEVTRFERWGKVPPDTKTMALHNVNLHWRNLSVPQLPEINLVEYKYCIEELKKDEISGLLTLFSDDLIGLHKSLAKALGTPQLQIREGEGRGGLGGVKAERKVWPIPGVGEIISGFLNCVFLNVNS